MLAEGRPFLGSFAQSASPTFLGPIDLSVTMGLKGDVDDSRVRAMLLSCVDRAKAAGVPVGALSMKGAFIETLFRHGLDFLAYGIDTLLMFCARREIRSQVESLAPDLI